GRNFTDLIALVPGARPDPNLSTGANIEIFGERAGAVSYLVDGAENNAPVNGGALLRFTQDSIKEFEVITTGYEAEFGRAQGGVANIVTRSGTDAVDGRAFWSARNEGFTGLFKIDGSLSASHRLTGSFNRSTLDNSGLISSPVAGTVALPSAAAARSQPATSIVARETAILTPSMFLETTGDYVRGE